VSIASVLTIYPTALKVEEALKARARAGDVSLGHRLTTFPQLVDALDGELVGAPSIVTEAIAIVLAQDALGEVLGAEATGERPGLASAALRAIGELKAACLGPAVLAAIARATGVDEARRSLRWLARVAAAYARRLARLGCADRHDRDRRVLLLLHRHEGEGTRPRVLAGVTRLVIAEIYDYSPLQSLITRALIRLVGDAELVTLAHGENVDATRFVERTWNRFVEDAAIADKVLPDFVVRGGRSGTLSRVLTGLFVEPKPSVPPAEVLDERVRVVVAPGRAAEVEEIGRRIRAVLAAGEAPERIAVLARDLGTYQPLLADVARRYHLPLAIGMARPLAAHASVQAVLRLGRAVADGLPRDALGAALESAYLTAAPRRVRRLLGTIGYVDAATLPLASCLVHAEVRLERRANGAAPARVREGSARALARLRRDGPTVAATVRRLGALAETRSLAAHAAALLDALGELGLALPSGDVAPGEAWSEGAALAALERLLADVAALGPLGTRRLSLASFLARLGEAVEAIDVEAPGPAASGVRVLPIAEARGLDFADVFVLGLDDGSFPAPLAEDALLGDGVRCEVNRHALPLVRAAVGPAAEGAPLGRVLRTSADRAAEDPFLFYLALSTAERRVVVSYPARDERGDALVRSPFVDEIVTILGEDVVVAAANDGVVPPAEAAADVSELMQAAVVAAAAGRPGMLAAVGARLPPGTLARLVARIRTERRRARYFLLDRERDAAAKEALADAFVGRLAPDPSRRERLRAMEWSASRLDELGACGFKFFAHRVLELEADELGNEALDVRDEGILVHRLLEAVLRRCDPLPSDPEAAVAAARVVADECRATLAAELHAADPELFALAWARALEAVGELVRGEGAVTPARRLLEWPFRFTIADHRPDVGTARLDLTLAGVLDRADLWLDDAGRIVAARVLDYKNAKRESDYAARLDAARAMGTTSFQVPLYALALTAAPELAWAADAEIGGGYVLMRADRKVLVRPIATALLARDPEARRAGAADPSSVPIASRIVELVADAAAGHFDVAPRECSRFCAYRHICRYEPPPEESE
jgi:hypothetical protein